MILGVQNLPKISFFFVFFVFLIFLKKKGLVEEYMNGHLKIDEYITGKFDLDQVNVAFDELHAGKAIRSIISVSKK